MIIRNAKEEDLEEIKKLYEMQGFDYPFPNLNEPLFAIKKVVEKDGKIIGAGVIKLQGEAYLFLNPNDSAKSKVQMMNELNDDICLESWKIGLDQISAWIPTEIEGKFKKRLTKMGWIKSKWNSWTRNLGD